MSCFYQGIREFGKTILVGILNCFYALLKKRSKDNEKFLKIAGSDEKLADMALGVLQGRFSIHDYRWKLISRYLYAYFKILFSRS